MAIKCPFCAHEGPPVIAKQMSVAGWVLFVVLLLLCLPLCWLPIEPCESLPLQRRALRGDGGNGDAGARRAFAARGGGGAGGAVSVERDAGDEGPRAPYAEAVDEKVRGAVKAKMTIMVILEVRDGELGNCGTEGQGE